MTIEVLSEAFSICQLAEGTIVDLTRPFTFLSRTDEELSLVCPTACVPEGTLAREDGWRALRIQGILDFSLIGILAGIAQALAEVGVSIFALSTWNTDYVLLREVHMNKAPPALKKAGYELVFMGSDTREDV